LRFIADAAFGGFTPLSMTKFSIFLKINVLKILPRSSPPKVDPGLRKLNRLFYRSLVVFSYAVTAFQLVLFFK
jgi:hypothetical protein